MGILRKNIMILCFCLMLMGSAITGEANESLKIENPAVGLVNVDAKEGLACHLLHQILLIESVRKPLDVETHHPPRAAEEVAPPHP